MPSGGCLLYCCWPATLATSTSLCTQATNTSPSWVLKTLLTRTWLIMAQSSLDPPWCSLRHIQHLLARVYSDYSWFITSESTSYNWVGDRYHSEYRVEDKNVLFYIVFSPSIPTTLCTAVSTSTWSVRRATCKAWRRVSAAPRRETSPSSVKQCPWTWQWLATVNWPVHRKSSVWEATPSQHLWVSGCDLWPFLLFLFKNPSPVELFGASEWPFSSDSCVYNV